MRPRTIYSCGTFFISLLLYSCTLAPTVTGEDSGEFIAAAYGWGVAHPPGYPLWTLLAGALIHLLPFVSPALCANFLSALLASLAAVVLFHILTRFFEASPLVAALGSLCFACGDHLWSQAVITEVYTLHILLFCLILYFVLAWLKKKETKYLYSISFLVGLSFTNHHLTILMIPILFGIVLWRQPRVFLQAKTVLICLLLLCLGLLPYLYLPLASHTHPYMNWGDPSTWENFWRHVLRKQYGDESMHQPRTWERFFGHLKILCQWNVKQYTFYAIPLIGLGVVNLLYKRKRLLLVTGAVFLIHSVGLIELLNPNFLRIELFANRVFQLPVYVITAIWLALGLTLLYQILLKLCSKERVALVAVGVLSSLLLARLVFVNFKDNNMHHYYYAYDHACNLLDHLDDDAIIIPSGDHNTFPLIYLHYIEGRRSDITIADKYGYIEHELYQEMPDAPLHIRTPQERQKIEDWLIRESGKPVYYTTKPRLENLPDYQAVTEGMLYRVVPQDQANMKNSWPVYSYRNLNNRSVIDHAASVILSDYHFHLAAKFLREHDPENAMLHVEEAARLSEGLKEEMNNLGTLMAEYGQALQAIRFYESAAKLDKNYLTPRWNLMHLFKSRDEIVPAIQVLNDLKQLDPEDFRIYGELGFLLYRQGSMDLAIQNWGKSLSLNPNQSQIVEALSKLGQIPQSRSTPSIPGIGGDVLQVHIAHPDSG